MSSMPQFRLERLLSIIRILTKANIFPEEDCKTIVMKIREFEYRIERVASTKYDFIKYFQYLQALHRLVFKRRRRFNHSLHFVNFEAKLHAYMKRLMWKAVLKDRNDVELWFDYIAFCQRVSRREDVSRVYTSMCQFHPDKEDVWITAAKYHFEEMRCPDVARNLYQTGLRDNPESLKLWREYFHFELSYSDMVLKRSEVLHQDLDDENPKKVSQIEPKRVNENDAVLSGKIAVVVFKNALKVISTKLTDASHFFQIVDTFGPALRTPVKTSMIHLLEENYPDTEEVYDFKARCLMDKHFACRYSNTPNERLSEFDQEIVRIELATKIYREGLLKFPTTKMWNLLLSFTMKNFARFHEGDDQDNPDHPGSLKNLLSLFDECWEAELMSRRAFLEWILLLQKRSDFDLINKLMIKGCQKWSKYADIWYLRLTLLARQMDSKEELKRLFTRAINEIQPRGIDEKDEEDKKESKGLKVRNMKKKSILDIWSFYIDWSSKSLHPSEVIRFIEKHFIELLQKGGDLMLQRKLSARLKPQLLKKSIELKKDGIKSARTFYEKYKNHPPVGESFFRTMLSIERNQSPVDFQQVVNVFEDFVANFGSQDHSIWLDYCKFLLESKKPQSLYLVYQRACRSLTPEEMNLFLASYNILQNEC